MPIKVTKVADVVDGQVLRSPSAKKGQYGELAGVLTGFEANPDSDPASGWKLELTLKRTKDLVDGWTGNLDLQPFLTPAELAKSMADPILIAGGKVIYFRNRLLMPERLPRNQVELEGVILQAKKIAYDEEEELTDLREQVANVEAALEYRRDGPKRTALADDVKLLVWARDGGACVSCRSRAALHFDHVIPVAKGGGNSAENIQILCAACNMKKSDKISG
jgi:hypothetical protein